jgi:hypothetical protein
MCDKDGLRPKTYGSSERRRADFGQIHRRDSGVDAGVDADDETAGDQHLVGVGVLRAQQQDRADGGLRPTF